MSLFKLAIKMKFFFSGCHNHFGFSSSISDIGVRNTLAWCLTMQRYFVFYSGGCYGGVDLTRIITNLLLITSTDGAEAVHEEVYGSVDAEAADVERDVVVAGVGPVEAGEGLGVELSAVVVVYDHGCCVAF